VVGEENYPEVRGYLERVLAGEAISYETKRNYNPASPSYLLVNIEPDVRDDSVVGMFVFGTDITEFRVAEAALAAETDLAETTLDSISEAVIRIGADGVVDFINPAAEDLIGLRADLARGRALVEVLPLVFSDGRQLAPMVMRKVVGQRTRFESEEELWLKRPGNAGGSWVMCLAVPLHGGPDGVGEGLVMLRDVTAQRREIQELAYRASHDTLTGLRNRREFERQLDRAVEEAAAGAAPFALIFMDLDGFKEINDAKGHLAGDQFLAQIGEAMRVVTRQEDVLARIGGDEFAVLARNCNVTAARAIAEKLLAAVRETRLTWDGVQFGVGISIGIAPVGTDAVDSRTVMNLADQACYAAKRAGKDRVEVATSDSGPVH
jgi:diguanylate cyclase (GGDEF)-like protein